MPWLLDSARHLQNLWFLQELNGQMCRLPKDVDHDTHPNQATQFQREDGNFVRYQPAGIWWCTIKESPFEGTRMRGSVPVPM